MHCQCVHEFGKPLQAQDRPDMEPQGTEVILRVTAAGVCHSDLHLREGGFDLGHGKRMSYAERGVFPPLVPGHETTGKVIAAGPEAGEIDPNAHYVVYPWCGCGKCAACKGGNEQLCAAPAFLGIQVDGGYATHIRVPHPKYLFDIRDLDPAFAAPLACSGLTTYSALKKVEHTIDDHRMVLIGGGGLGLMCLQLLKARGAKAPVVVDIDPSKRAAALAAGAAMAVDPADNDAIAQIHKACDGAPMGVIDFVGAPATAELGFDVLGKGGTLVMVGLFGGAAPWALPLIPAKAITVCGSYTGSLSNFAELMELVHTGALTAIPTKTWPLSQAEDVLQLLEEGKIVGRALLDPSG
jgi:propanol-preferring alcohol dehydrogenase